jgi:hypothetical protein
MILGRGTEVQAREVSVLTLRASRIKGLLARLPANAGKNTPQSRSNQ